MKRVNRLGHGKVVMVSSLPVSLMAVLFLNGFLFLFFTAIGFSLYIYSSGSTSTGKSIVVRTIEPLLSQPLPLSMATATPAPTWTLLPTATAAPTWTLLPTATPAPTWTLLPTATAAPTGTLPPTATPVSYSLEYLNKIGATDASNLVRVSSDYSIGFYRAVCFDVPGQQFIQPRVITSVDIYRTGYRWKLDNELSGYGYVDWLVNSKNITFYLSENSSKFSIQLFWFNEPVSDKVMLDFPVSCAAVEIIFVDAVALSTDVDIIKVVK